MNVKVMPSLGDAIYCRPFVRAFASSIETKWPDLFGDIEFSGVQGPSVAPRYTTKNLALGSIVKAIGRFFPEPDPFVFDLPAFKAPDLGRYAVIRPPSLRQKFYAPARNPRPEYIGWAAAMLREAGYVTVGVGNVHDGEWFDGSPPSFDVDYTHGELDVPELMGLISSAAVIVAGPGYTVPASMAYGVPHIIVYGGTARWNSLDKITDPRIDASRLFAIEPDRFCTRCRNVAHDCDKTISDFERKFADAFGRALHLSGKDIQGR